MKTLGTQLSLPEVAGELTQPIVRYLERYVGERALAQDLAQETLLRIGRGLAAFDGRASLKTWAFSIATRVAADHFRGPGRRARIVDLNEIAELPAADAAIDERMVVDEMSACVRQVIDSLPEAYRAALILHDLEDLSAMQVGEICACSTASAKIRIHRARARLREALRKECEFYRGDDGVFRCDRKG